MIEPYYADEWSTIYHADCLDVLQAISGVDLVVTSPPYNMADEKSHTLLAGGLMRGGYDTYGDAMPQDEYDRWQTETLCRLWATLSDDGAIFYNHKPRIQGGVAMLPTAYGATLPLRQVIIWDRATGLNFNDSYFLPKHEWVVVWAKPGWRLASRPACEIGDVWRFPPEQATTHPAPFPLGLPLRAIGATNAQMILDPFMGSGTTLRAAKDLNRRAIGIDVSERYCEIAAKRLAQEVLPL